MKSSVRILSGLFTVLVALLLLTGCGRSGENPEVAKVKILRGAEQAASPSKDFDEHLRVELLGPTHKNFLGVETSPVSVPGVKVIFRPEENSDLTVTPAEAVTDETGCAAVKVSAGAKIGDNYLRVIPVGFEEKASSVRYVVGAQVSGGLQEGSAGSLLNKPVAVRLFRPDGSPASGVDVFFSVQESPDQKNPAKVSPVMLKTDENGVAQTSVRLGGGTGENRIGIEVADPASNYYMRMSSTKVLGIDLATVILSTLAGLSFFIFGMKLMGDGLLKISGENMKKILQFFSRNRIVAILAGTLVTAIIQSSSATTVMVIGFINAGLLTLTQSIGIIFGANIGTTVTAQIIAFNLDALALPAIILGFLLTMLAKKRLTKGWGETLLGFGLLFFGMTMMSTELKNLGSFPTFIGFFRSFNCTPVPGGFMPIMAVFGAIVIGAIATFVIQSSSAAIGIILALAAGGLINFYTAVPLLIGTNIGTTVTSFLASLTANRVAKQAALAHFMFNVVGATLIIVTFYIPYGPRRIPCFLYFINSITPGDAFASVPIGIERHIAMAHTFFNVLTVLVLTPLTGAFARFCTWLLPIRDEASVRISSLEPRLLATPAVAIDQVIFELRKMVAQSWEMVDLAVNRHFAKQNTDSDAFHELAESEQHIDEMQSAITNYLVQITRRELTQHQSGIIPLLMHCTNDAERIADHTENILKLTKRLSKTGAHLSDIAIKDLNKMFGVLRSQAENVTLALGSASGQFSIESALESERRINKLSKKYQKTFIRKKEAGTFDTISPDVSDQDEPFAEANADADPVASLAIRNEHEINQMAKMYEKEHIDRRNNGQCAVEPSVIFIEMLWELERIGDHLANIAVRAPEIQKHYFAL